MIDFEITLNEKLLIIKVGNIYYRHSIWGQTRKFSDWLAYLVNIYSKMI